MFNVAKTLTIKDREELIKDYGYVEIVCDFCKTKYQFKEF